MPKLSLIVATANDRIIGKDNDMPWHLPADLAYFKRMTLGKPIIMGRKTYESIGRPLPGRRNIVISRNPNFIVNGVEVVSSVEQALSLFKGEEEIMVIGGGAIYEHCIKAATRLYITHIDADIDGDTRFPDFNVNNEWEVVSTTKLSADEKNAYDVNFCLYQKI